jgi:hypothetical protein
LGYLVLNTPSNRSRRSSSACPARATLAALLGSSSTAPPSVVLSRIVLSPMREPSSSRSSTLRRSTAAILSPAASGPFCVCVLVLVSVEFQKHTFVCCLAGSSNQAAQQRRQILRSLQRASLVSRTRRPAAAVSESRCFQEGMEDSKQAGGQGVQRSTCKKGTKYCLPAVGNPSDTHR